MLRMAVHLEETCSYYQLNLGKIVPTTLEKFGSFKKFSVYLQHDIAIPLLGIDPTYMKAYADLKIVPEVHNSLFVIAKNWE